MLIQQIIEKKRDGLSHTADEIRTLIRGVTEQSIPDYQLSAWLMAVVCRGMNESETAALTECMLDSGVRLQRCTEKPRVDKHSTGGLGDKTSLILAPLLACVDVDVPMLSGRGLGITGGTLDKLEAFDGYRTTLDQQEIARQLQQIGCVITGTTEDITPADRRLYALRDVTGTVPSVALITASIMSKKLAESLDALVLDVKFGSGAFMRSIQEARDLEASLVKTGSRMGVQTVSLVTDMNQPLGRMVGNACEVNEALDILSGMGPHPVRQLSLALAAKVLVASGICRSTDEATARLIDALDQGRAKSRFQAMVEAQGGRFVDRLPLAKESIVCATHSGWLGAVDGSQLGSAIISMGGGRRRQGDALDHQVGLEMLAEIGDSIERGQPLIRAFFDGSASQIETLHRQLHNCLSIQAEPVAPPVLYEMD
jgi:pyrimidine-nucleoside phosphorylase